MYQFFLPSIVEIVPTSQNFRFYFIQPHQNEAGKKACIPYSQTKTVQPQLTECDILGVPYRPCAEIHLIHVTIKSRPASVTYNPSQTYLYVLQDICISIQFYDQLVLHELYDFLVLHEYSMYTRYRKSSLYSVDRKISVQECFRANVKYTLDKCRHSVPGYKTGDGPLIRLKFFARIIINWKISPSIQQSFNHLHSPLVTHSFLCFNTSNVHK